MKKVVSVILCVLLMLTASVSMASAADMSTAGALWQTQHFTAESVTGNANTEDFNPNPEFAIYSINDYSEAVPYAYSDTSNGVASAERPNNCASMYMVLSKDVALVIDLGNGAAATAGNFGEDKQNADVTAAIDAEFKQLVTDLADGRQLVFAITHNHGDHLGYRTAFADTEGIKVYFPKADYTKEYFGANFDVVLFDPGELTIDLGNGVTVETIWAGGHSAGSTVFAVNVPHVQYQYGTNGKPVSSTGVFHVFGGDAIGSGAGVWIFSADALKMLSESIPGVVAKLETYNTYSDGLSEAPCTDGTINVLGGHGWQKFGRFGELTMDIEFVRNLQTALEIAAKGEWVDEGNDTSKEAQLLAEGNVVLYNWGMEHWLGNTIYYGKDISRVNGVDLNMNALNTYAGKTVETTK